MENVKYVAEYDAKTMLVTGIYPSTRKVGVAVPDDIADQIFNGVLSLSACTVEVVNKKMLVSLKSKTSIKDTSVLHRIPNKQYTKVTNPDVKITVNLKNKTVSVSLSRAAKEYVDFYPNDAEIRLIITEYNNPTAIIDLINIPVKQLQSHPFKAKISLTSGEYSIFTSRIFKTYTIDEK